LSGPFDGIGNAIGGAVSGAENAIGGFLQNFIPGNSSAPAQPSNPPLPSPMANPTQKQSQPIGNLLTGTMNPRTPQQQNWNMLFNNPGQFAQNTGLTQLGNDFLNTDFTKNDNVASRVGDQLGAARDLATQDLTGYGADPKLAQGITNPAGYIANVLNAGVVDPVALAANPQMWFAENSDNGDGRGNLGVLSGDFTGSNPGHNYLRDVFAPIVKDITGEDVPHTTMYYAGQAQALTAQGNKLAQARAGLTDQSSQRDIDAFNTQLAAYQSQVDQYNTEYQKSADWWTNSNIAKTMSVIGQIATFPAGFAAGFATFLPSFASDPMGTGESMISQVQMAANFVNKVMDPDARAHMSAQEWAANISNIGMLAGMIYGAKRAPGDSVRVPGNIRDTIVGPRPDQALQAKLQTDLHESVPELKNPEPSPALVIDANDKVATQTHLEQRQQDIEDLQNKIIEASDPNSRAVLQKQLNDIQDETQNIKSSGGLLNRIKSALPENIQDYQRANDSQLINAYFKELLAGKVPSDQNVVALREELQYRGYSEWELLESSGIPELEEMARTRSDQGFYHPGVSRTKIPENEEVLYDQAEREQTQGHYAEQAVSDAANERLTEQPGQYTKPVYPHTGFTDAPVDSLLRDLSDFTQPSIQQAAMQRNPQDYASASARTTGAPTVKWEDMTPSAIQSILRNTRFAPTTMDKLRGNGWISPGGKAINISSFDYSPHQEFISEVQQPGDNRTPNQVSRDLLKKGWIKKSTISGMVNFGTWGLNPEKIGLLNEAILSDMLSGKPPYPYQIADESTHFPAREVTPEEFAANDFDLAKVIRQQDSLRPRAITGKAPLPQLTSQLLNQIAKDRGWRVTATTKVQYGFLLPGNKGIDIREGGKYNGDHKEFWIGLSNALKQTVTGSQFRDFRLNNNIVELRRGSGYDSTDYYFWAEGLTSQVKNTIQDYLLANPTRGERNGIVLEISTPSGKPLDSYKFTYDEFKDNDFNLDGLAHIKALAQTGGINEKANTTPLSSGADVAPGTTGEGYNQAPPGAPKGSTLTSVIQWGKEKRPLAIWTPDAESARTLSARERGSLELKQALQEAIQSFTSDYGEVEDIAKLEQIPANFFRRANEIISTFTTQGDGLDPLGIANINHLIIDPEMKDQALFDPNTGQIHVNPLKLTPIEWARGAAGAVQRGLAEMGNLISDEGRAAAFDWIKVNKELTQSQLDFRALSEEILHKYDIDSLKNPEYLKALATLPVEWWTHAYNSGMADIVEGGLISSDANGNEFTLKTHTGQPVSSWLDAYYAARENLLDGNSYIATINAFREYRVNQLLIYHGVPGVSFTYRVPEVMYRELENPNLIKEGARIAGDSFEQYVQTNTAPRFAQQAVSQEEASTNASTAVPGVPELDAANSTIQSSASAGNSRRAGRDKRNIKQDFPQVGDILEVNQNTPSPNTEPFIKPQEPNWIRLWDHPFRDIDEVRKAINVVNTRGVGPIYSQPSFAQDFRVVNPKTGQVRNFSGELPQELQPTPERPLTPFSDKREMPETFHNIPSPDVPQGEVPTQEKQQSMSPFIAGTGFNRRALNLVDEITPKPPKIKSGSPPDSIGARFQYRPLIELGRTGYPGTWEDFLASMSSPEDSIAYRTAKPYWEKLDARWQETFMEAMGQPGVARDAIARQANPSPEPVVDVNSPAFQARQAKIVQYREDVERSGALLDRLRRSISTAKGLDDYNKLKAVTAAKIKYTSIPPGVPEKEAAQIMGQEFTRALNELTEKKESAPLPDAMKIAPDTNNLVNQLQPVLRAFLTSKVTMKEGHYPSLTRFIDAFAGGEPEAKLLYNKLPKLSKEAIRNIVTQMPQSFQLPGSKRLDQSSVPESQQASQEHINPTSAENFRSIVEMAPKLFVRHGSTEYNERGLVRAHDNPPLSSLGRLQARNLGRAFTGRRNLKIVTHDLDRAHETAIAIARMARGSKVTVDPDLRPWNVGKALTGTSVTAANPRMQKMMFDAPDYVPEGGESWNQFVTRYLGALRRHIYTSDVIVGSTRNLRLAEGWIQKGDVSSDQFEDGPMKTEREIGPGGIMAVGNRPDGTYTITHKASQMPATAGKLDIPKVQTNIPMGPDKVVVKLGRTAPVKSPVPLEPSVEQQVRYNIKLKTDAETKASNIKGEISPLASEDVSDTVDSIASDPSIAPTEPIKIAAVRAKIARDAITFGKTVEAPNEAIQEQVKEYNIQLNKVTQLAAEQAQRRVKIASTEVKPTINKLIHDTSLAKAKEHFKRVGQGQDWHESATRIAKEMGIFDKKDPFGDATTKIKNAINFLLPSDHPAYSLAPAFKDAFVDPKALELLKREKLIGESRKQGALPMPVENLLGSDTPTPAAPNKVTVKLNNRKPKNPAPPAIADRLSAMTPSTVLPQEESVAELPKQYKINIGQHEKLSTTDLRAQTKELTDSLNQESPSIVGPEISEELENEGEDVFDSAKAGSGPKSDAQSVKVKIGSGGGGKKPPIPPDPYKGWDDARDFAGSFGGDMKSLSRRMDYALKAVGKLINPSMNTAHPKAMAKVFGQARVETIMIGDDIHDLLKKLYPAEVDKKGNWSNLEQLSRHQAIAKAVGGSDDVTRTKALRELSAQDQAVAGMLHKYYDLMGHMGVRMDAKVFDEFQENYFPRRVILDEKGQAPIDTHGNTKYSTRMGIARERRKRTIIEDADGQKTIRTENLYKDNEDLKKAGFKVEENIASLWKYHWDAFSNMNIAHQFISLMSSNDMQAFNEGSIKPRKVSALTSRTDIPPGSEAYSGRILVPRAQSIGGKVQSARIDEKYRNQLITVNKGPWERVLANYHVYKPVAEELERLATVKNSDSLGERLANGLSWANGIYKVFKFAFNALHLFNLVSNVYALGTKGLRDRAMYDPTALHHRIFGRVDALLSDEDTFKDWNGQPIHGRDIVAKLMGWGAVLPKEIVDVASLGGLTGTLSRNVPGFRQWHNIMWHDIAWKGHIGLSLHLLDVMRTELAKPENLGRELNEAEFENAGRLAVTQSKHAMGFITKDEMTRDWQIYANSLFLANSWSLSQARFLGQVAPQSLPGAKYLANLGGGETYNDVVTEQMRTLGGMSQKSLDAINSFQGRTARRLMLGGSAKLLAISMILSYIGSYIATGNGQGPWQNYQRDPTRTFDIYLGTDPITGKDRWQHNSLFGMQQEMLLYLMQGIKDHNEGSNPYDTFLGVAGRIANKANPILSTGLDEMVNRNLSLYLQGYGDRSDISADPNIIAIRRAIDSTGMNPFPGGWENNALYAVRQLFPSPGFPDTLDTHNGSAPAQTNATLGNVLNALGPGKVLGMGDIINAVQTGDTSQLAPKLLGGLAMWATGSRISTSSTPDQILQNNQIGQSIATRDARDQSLADMARAAQAGDWKTVAQITQELGLTNSQMLEALQHPPAGFNAGPGIIYKGLPYNPGTSPVPQDTLQGTTLTPGQTTELESLKEAHNIAMLAQVTALPEFNSADATNRTAMLASYQTLISQMVNDQYSQHLGLLGGTPITNGDIQGALNTAIEFHGLAQDVLSHMDLYVRADPIQQQRMETTFGQYAIGLAKDAFEGNLRGVPIENVRQILTYTIQAEETTRGALENSMYYNLAAPGDQQRMLSEYSSLAREMAKREALGQGQGSYAFEIPPDKIIPTIEFIMYVEESGKVALHGTDYYAAADPQQQKSLDMKYETLARGLAFSTSNADPRTLIENSLRADQGYYDLQNQFGGSSYIKLMAQQLSDMEHSVRVSAAYSPQQISSIERGIRAQFLAQNPAYAAWLKTRSSWEKNTTDGQLYLALNNSEYAAVADMQAAGVIPSESLLLAGGSTDNSMLDPSTQLGLPSIDYNTFNQLNP
jgi:hypothetical protein